MYLAVYLPLVIPVLAALAARPLADRLPPATATWLLAASSLALALTSSAVLGLLALSALVRIPFVATIAKMSVPVFSRGYTVSVPVAIAAGALLAAAATAAILALWRRGTAIFAAGRQARRLPGSGQVVVTEDDAADAYTLPGWPCRVVITSGMLRALSAPERAVLLAHERSHAAGSHYLFTSAARLAAAANPLLRPLAAQVGYTVERWADERAARATGDRPLTARAIARAALATSAAPPDPDTRAAPLTALGIVTAPARGTYEARHRVRRPGLRGAGPVPRRVAALLAPPPRPSLLLVGAAVALVAISGASALDAAHSLHALVELAQAGA
jgi:Zn-dependent protease with chaperone function